MSASAEATAGRARRVTGMAKLDAIGLIGIGNIGAVIAEKLLRSGIMVVGYSKPTRRTFAETGGTPVASPKATRQAMFLIGSSTVQSQV